jgi:hypothetical protein
VQDTTNTLNGYVSMHENTSEKENVNTTTIIRDDDDKYMIVMMKKR